MPSIQRYMPIVNAQIVASKEMEKHFSFYEMLDHQITETGLEEAYANAFMEQKKTQRENFLRLKKRTVHVSPKKLAAFYLEGEKAFRVNLVLQLKNVSYRELHLLLACDANLQSFCRLSNLKEIIIPSKSLIQKWATFLSEDKLTEVYHNGVKNIFANGAYNPGDLYGDSTCVQANMHYPVDWLFIVDGIRTMLKAITLIREQGLKSRMAPPSSFMTKINKLSMAMSGATRTKDAKKKRKATLRLMKDLEKKVRQHGQRHLDLFMASWQETEYAEGNAQQIINRLGRVIELMPQIIWQAHERIIGERLVDNADKILSLYQEDVHVVVRNKMGAQREFGNQLLIVEQVDGFIVDYCFNKDKIEHDSKMMPESIERFKKLFGKAPDSFCGDRGFSSPANSKLLAKENIFNAICPKSVPEMIERMKEKDFRTKIKRRGQNEGRVGIFKNKFAKLALRVNGYENRHSAILWGLIAHNLWVEVNDINEAALLQAAA